jgi:hypothetical protein
LIQHFKSQFSRDFALLHGNSHLGNYVSQVLDVKINIFSDDFRPAFLVCWVVEDWVVDVVEED